MPLRVYCARWRAWWLLLATAMASHPPGAPAVSGVPGPVTALVGQAAPPGGMARGVVFWDERLDSVGQAKHQERLVPWLVANGLKQVRSEDLAAWMRARIAAGGAYGSVAALTMGYAPAYLAEEPGEGILWIRFLKAGGRIVSIGDLPFNYFQYPNANPVPQGINDRGYGALGLTGGWDKPYWGRNLEVTPTPQAKAWGFETMDGSITGFAVEQVTIPFGTYVVPETGKLGATSWLRCLNPEMPWSGLIKLCQVFDGRNDAQLRDVWRAAHYVGEPVAVPPLPPAWETPKPPATRVDLSGSGIRGRSEFARGERIDARVEVDATLAATRARIELLDRARVLVCQDGRMARAAVDEHPVASFPLHTGAYAYGAYRVRFTALAGRKPVGVVARTIGIRHVPPEAFLWHVWTGVPANPYRRGMTFADIQAAGMEPHLADPTIEGMDAVLRHNIGFSLRYHPDLAGGKEVSWERSPELFRLDLDRKPIPSAYAGGRPTLGIAHPEARENARRTLREGLKPLARHPAFRPYVLTNDDYSIYYGWDFSPHVVERFRQATGLDAPAKMETPSFGAVDESHPWLRWCEFTLREVTGGINRAETQGAQEARPDIRIGPIPGGMQIPLIHMWQAAQYPPLNFGRHGFNLVSSYYYNTYWQPVLTNTFWMEVGRMGNRGLPQWCMPDLFMTAGYQRNNLFHLLAGRVRGLAYFTYNDRNPGTWAEVKRLAPRVQRIAPVQARLRPAPRKDIGLLHSLTTNCFDPGHQLVMVYAYANLMQAHFDVEPVCEEEILAGRAGRYKAVLLYNVRWLRQSVYDALASHAAGGGLVLLDNSVPFDIPGARRVNIDLGMGRQHTTGVPPEGAHASTPGIRDYGDPARIAAIRGALSRNVRPWFGCTDIRLVGTRFQAGGTPHVWFVNAHTGKEYMFCRERMGAGHPGAGTPEKVAELMAWEKREMSAGPYTAAPAFARLPGVPYDLVAGRRVKVSRAGGGSRLHLSMDRFGGALVAFYPEEIRRVAVSAPAAAKPLQKVTAEVRVMGTKAAVRGVVPVDVTLLGPAGARSPLSGVYAAENGILRFRWTPAINDALGKWTLRATELASGRQAAVALTLAAQ